MIFGSPASFTVRAALLDPARGALAGLLHLPFLALDLLLGVAHIALGDSLTLPHRLFVRGEIASVEVHFAAAQFGDAVHPIQKRRGRG